MNKSKIARTGRVQSWLDNPHSRLPVSCTIFEVQDSMEGLNGIEASWRFVSHALRYGAGVAVHLSKIRPAGTDNGNGLVASGPCSFAKIYSCLNEQLRRGGIYKNGAVVCHLDINHADILEFVSMRRTDLPWAKRCVNVTTDLWNKASEQVKAAILSGIASGDIWLAKIRHDQNGKRIFANVCLEIFIKSRATCLLEHVNLGACTIDNLPMAFHDGMCELIDLHGKTGVQASGEYLSPSEDRQVGLGMLGLANLLAIEGVKYSEFGDALAYYLEDTRDLVVNPTALKIVKALDHGLKLASEVAREANMDRAFTIAPTASCSYTYSDRNGFTTTPEIAPPIGRVVDRDSSTFGVQQFNYGNVETAEEVGWPAYKAVADGIMSMLHLTGLAHGYSYNSWSDVVVYDNAFIEDWLESPQTSLYYSLQVMQNTQAKDDALAALEGTDYKEMFGFEEWSDPSDDNLFAVFNDPGSCVGCAE
mgnify:CR=1 FL=1